MKGPRGGKEKPLKKKEGGSIVFVEGSRAAIKVAA